MEESDLGHYERRLLELAGGTPNILDYVDNMSVEDLQGRGRRNPLMLKKIDEIEQTA